MPDPIKRMNFFDRQYLRASDFQVEQDYQTGRRRRHTQLLHTPGVAEGLSVSGAVNATTVTVSPGMAIDVQGREIVLAAAKISGPMPPAPVTKVEIYIVYAEAQSDPSTDPGITGNTRITENPNIVVRRTLPAPDSPPADGVLLAEVNLNNGILAAAPNTGVRARAGTVIGDDFTVRTLTLRRDGVAASQFPKLSCSEANQAALENSSLKLDNNREILFQDNGQIRSLDNNHRLVFNRAGNSLELHETGDIRLLTGTPTPTEKMKILANGNVGIGTTTPTHRIDIEGDTRLRAAANTNLLITQGPSSEDVAINFIKDTNTTPSARIGLNGFADQAVHQASLHFFTRGASDTDVVERMQIAENGNVGIGTTSPGAKLEVVGNLKTGNLEFGTTETAQNKMVLSRGLLSDDLFIPPGTPPKDPNNFKVSLATNPRGNPPPKPVYQFVIGHTQLGVGFQFSFITKFRVNNDGDIFAAGAKTGYVTDYFINRVGDTLEQGDVVVIRKQESTRYYGHEKNIPIPEVDLTDKENDTRVCGIVVKVVSENDLPPVEFEQLLEGSAKQAAAKKGKTKKKEDMDSADNDSSELHPLQQFAAPFSQDLDKKQIKDNQMGLMATLGAFAHCKADADIAPIEPGDLLTTSPTKGHAQKVLNPGKAVGAIIGKALGSLKKGKGKIPVLVMLQ